MEVKLLCPFRVNPSKTGRGKTYSINLNQYRNWHPMVENSVKKKFTEIMFDQIKMLFFDQPIEVTYQVFKPTKRRLDKMNVVSITSKYVLDALVECHCIPDDNDDFVKEEHILPTEMDRDNPRVEVTIKTVS